MSKVYFVGCGPGDPDLITVKAKKLIQNADVVVYSGSLIPPEILKLCKKARTYDAAKLVREEIFDLLKKNAKKGKNVVRLHDGDPSIYGAIREQMDNLYKEKIDSVIVPGVTSFLASAAALGAQLTLPGVTQTMIITRAEKRTKVPKREKISELAKHRATMIFYLSIHLLSSTHLPFLESFLRLIFKNVKFLDPAENVANDIKNLIRDNDLQQNILKIFTSGDVNLFKKNLQMMGINNEVSFLTT